MDIKNKLQLLTLQLRLRQLILDGKSLLRLLYPTKHVVIPHGTWIIGCGQCVWIDRISN